MVSLVNKLHQWYTLFNMYLLCHFVFCREMFISNSILPFSKVLKLSILLHLTQKPIRFILWEDGKSSYTEYLMMYITMFCEIDLSSSIFKKNN